MVTLVTHDEKASFLASFTEQYLGKSTPTKTPWFLKLMLSDLVITESVRQLCF